MAQVAFLKKYSLSSAKDLDCELFYSDFKTSQRLVLFTI